MTYHALQVRYNELLKEYDAIPISDILAKHQVLMELGRINREMKAIEKSISSYSTPGGNYPGIMSPIRIKGFMIDPIKIAYGILAFFTLVFIGIGIYIKIKQG